MLVFKAKLVAQHINKYDAGTCASFDAGTCASFEVEDTVFQNSRLKTLCFNCLLVKL